MAQSFSATVTLTSDATTIAYGMRPNSVRIDSSTAGTAFLNFSSTIIATTASSLGYPLTSGAAALVFSGMGRERNGLSSQFSAVTSAGGSTVVRILAVRI